MKNFTLLSSTASTLADVIPFEVTVTNFDPEPFSQALSGEVLPFAVSKDPAAICGLTLLEDARVGQMMQFAA